MSLKTGRVVFCLALAMLALSAGVVQAQELGEEQEVGGGGTEQAEPHDITRIDEDWELVVGEPSPDDTAPQIMNFISPTLRIDAEAAVLELNHATLPQYVDGGVQFQRWYGDYERIYRQQHTTNRLQIANETITYTMTMRLGWGMLKFGVRNGVSETWGTFGGTDNQWNSTIWSPYVNLDQYSPAVSTKYSRVGYASNRVKKFTLKEVRYYRYGEMVHKSTAEQIVHETTPVEAEPAVTE